MGLSRTSHYRENHRSRLRRTGTHTAATLYRTLPTMSLRHGWIYHGGLCPVGKPLFISGIYCLGLLCFGLCCLKAFALSRSQCNAMPPSFGDSRLAGQRFCCHSLADFKFDWRIPGCERDRRSGDRPLLDKTFNFGINAVADDCNHLIGVLERRESPPLAPVVDHGRPRVDHRFSLQEKREVARSGRKTGAQAHRPFFRT